MQLRTVIWAHKMRIKKLVFAKLERMRLLSESELRNILFNEIKENKKFLETLYHQTNSNKLLK